MLISSCCFLDEELKSEVENEFTHSDQICDVCGIRGNLIKIDHFAEFFVCIVGLFKKDSSSQSTLIDIVQSKWHFFSNKLYGEVILSTIISEYGLSISVHDKVSFIDDIQYVIDIWKNIKNILTSKYRYFVDSDEIDKLDLITFDSSSYRILHKGDVLFRARITEEGKAKMTPKEMKCPPRNKSCAGRANPVGIPYLYLCQSIKTTFYEVHAGYLDNISVGRFRMIRDLNIIDFDFQLSPFPVFVDGGKDELLKQISKCEFLQEIRSDLSKPLTRYDTELEYVPTQWICEYCKINGADGISFTSSLDKTGVNYVLFDQNDAKCTKVTAHTIKKN